MAAYSLSWSMYHVDFVRLGAMIKSVVFVTTGILFTQLLCISMYLSHVFCELVKIAKMSLIANGLNAFHIYTHVLHAICDGMAVTQL